MTTHREDLLAQPASELIAIHNGLAQTLSYVGAPELKSWKKAKALLVDQIEELRNRVHMAEEAERLAAEEADRTVEDETTDDVPPEATEKTTGERTIRAAAIELLCLGAYYEDRTKKSGDDNRVEASDKTARSVGLPYDEIIRRIQAEFPECSTTVACLRWYSVKIRVEEHGYEGLKLPQRRPRAKPRTAG